MLLRFHYCSISVIDGSYNSLATFRMYMLHDFRKFLRLPLLIYMFETFYNLAGCFLWLNDLLCILRTSPSRSAFLLDLKASLVTFMGLRIFGILGIHHQLKEVHSGLKVDTNFKGRIVLSVQNLVLNEELKVFYEYMT